MKFLLMFSLLVSASAFAYDIEEMCKNTVQVCDEEMKNLPCALTEAEASSALADMMIDNVKGYMQIASGAQAGFMIECVKVTMVSDDMSDRREMKSEMKYEVIMNDCRGTDACYGYSLWTVDQATVSDGYTYYSDYENTLAPIK